MIYKIKYTFVFFKNIKKLARKYKSIKKDLNVIILELEKNPKLGTDLGNGFYKIRLKNSDNNKGKSGGYRIITYYNSGDTIILITIYSKSEQENIGEDILLNILKNYNSDLI